MKFDRVIVFSKRSMWAQYQLDPLAFGELGPAAKQRAEASHSHQVNTLNTVLETLRIGRIRPWLIEGAETSFVAGPDDLVVCVGGDGTLLSASHNLSKDTPLIGVNSDPVFSKGHFCKFTADSFMSSFMSLDIKESIAQVTRMKVTIDGRPVADRILNEALFSHTCPAAMTRLEIGGAIDLLTLTPQRFACSGAWIGTGAGSSGAIMSAGGSPMSLTTQALQAVVREPFDPNLSPGNKIVVSNSIILVSKTADATLYLDGPFLRVPVGFDQVVVFEPSEQHLSLVV